MLQLEDGSEIQFPQAIVRDSTGSAVAGSPFTLVHVDSGFYDVDIGSFADDHYGITYITYSDAPHTTESLVHFRAAETIEVRDFGSAGAGQIRLWNR